MNPPDLRRPPPPVPRGWKTTAQWARHWRLSYTYVNKLLREAHRLRTIRRRSFLIQTPAGARRALPHYAMK